MKEFLSAYEFAQDDLLTSRDQDSISNMIDQAVGLQKKINELNANSHYTDDKLNFQALGKVSIDEVNTVPGVRGSNGILKPWDDLGADQKKQLTEIIVTHVYIPTLVHEIGHNLGLRHNFEGSVDKENFYTKKDVEALGMKGAPAYSSIMDYGYSHLNSLSTFGSYDVAALKFSQNGQVDAGTTRNQEVGSLALNKIPNLKPYKFCTDKDAGTGLMCNRFDEGTDELEILTQKMERYTKSYRYSNVSNREYNLNDRGNWNYFWRQYSRLAPVRQVHELWQGYHTYLTGLGLPELMFTGCSDAIRSTAGEFCSSVDKIISANERAGRFLLDIIKQPELTCHVQFDATLATGQVFEGAALFLAMEEELSNMEFPMINGKGNYRPTSCFDPNVAPFLADNLRNNLVRQCQQAPGANQQACETNTIIKNSKAIGQTGAIHNDVRAVEKDDRDQEIGDIEIRGIWIDKMIAMEFLTNRSLMTTAGASNNISFTDHPAFRTEIDNLLNHFAYGETLMSQVPIERENGEIYYSASFDANVNIMTNFIFILYIVQRCCVLKVAF